ncbi:hypothetical protein ACQP04_36365 [Pseudonocardia halophobica]|uniref:hypothetical protein n=1 Tax=Pseudonocardia halophobica TaxID=29401 RepID=UPI003D8BA255
MLVRTDDEVYRVDSVWLGPPRATFPWRARYVSYGVGLLVMIVIMFLQRRIGIGLDFFSVAWALVLTVVATRFLGKKIDYERPLSQVAEHFRHEVTGPRRRRRGAGGPVRFAHVRTRRALPRPGRPAVPEPRPAERTAPEPELEPVPQVVEAAPVLRDVTPVEAAPDAAPDTAPRTAPEPAPRAAPRRVGRRPAAPQPWATSAQRRETAANNGWKGSGRGRA